MLANKEQLESVHLEGSFVTDSALEALRGNSSLRSLTIIGPVGDQGLQVLGALHSLRHLEVRRNYKRRDTPVITDGGLLRLNGLGELVTLTMVSSEIKGSGLAIASLPALEGLTITGANLSDEGLEFLPADSNLRMLLIDFDSITRAAAGELLDRCPRLTFGPYGRNVPRQCLRP